MVRHVLGMAWVVYSLSVLGVVFAPDQTSVVPRLPVRTGYVFSTPVRGFTLNLHYTDDLQPYITAVDEIASLGCNSLQVVTPVFQADGSSHEIKVETGPGRGPGRRQIVDLLRHAKRRGLMTSLMPQVLFTHPQGNEWRGKIHPRDWAAWWGEYREIVRYFIGIANEAGVDIFCVGSELLSTEGHTKPWQSLIAMVRAQFDGVITYSTNWDHYHVPGFWASLDLIGINGYWDIATLTDRSNPSIAALTKRWEQIRQTVLAFAQAQGSPVLFTEMGYPSLPWGLKDPWNYLNPQGVAASTNTQTLGYAAFLSAWGDLLASKPVARSTSDHVRNNGLAGVFFYEWDPDRSGGDSDAGYGVRGKPTFDLLRTWLADE